MDIFLRKVSTSQLFSEKFLLSMELASKHSDSRAAERSRCHAVHSNRIMKQCNMNEDDTNS